MAWSHSHGTGSPAQSSPAWVDDSYSPESRGKALRRALAPLIRHLEDYDKLRIEYEEHGMLPVRLNQVTAHLTKTLSLKSSYGIKLCVTLVDQKSLRNALFDIGHSNLHLAVRKSTARMPLYYLVRTRSDYWTDYPLILEDYYRSSAYSLHDSRFVRLMRHGHESYHLRLASLREAATRMVEDRESASSSAVDRVLRKVGREVLQSAWHEDQRLALATAETLGIPRFQQAIEVLYLCLSADLCRLRNVTDEELLAFFAHVYPQQAIRSFLEALNHLEGGQLTDLPERALKLYARLSKAYSRLLHIEVPWGRTNAHLPLYKLLFANVDRMELLGDALRAVPAIVEAAPCLDADAQAIIEELLSGQPRE